MAEVYLRSLSHVYRTASRPEDSIPPQPGRDLPLLFCWSTCLDIIAMLNLPARSAKKMSALNHLVSEAVIAADNDRWLSFSRSRDHYATIGQRYHGGAYTYAHVVPTVDELVRAGLLEERRARPGDHLRTGLQSRVRATPALIAIVKPAPLQYVLSDPIRLRNADGELIPYSDTHRTRQMRRRLATVNGFLSSIDVRLDEAMPAPVLHRVFNRGSWMKGGRLYTGLQNLPKARRADLQLDGNKVVEADFVQLHAAIAYDECGVPLDFDAYVTEEFPRQYGKIAFNVALNSANKPTAIGAVQHALGIQRGDAARLLGAVESRNRDIKQMLYTDAGIRFMRKDSELMADCLDECVKRDIPCLPVHDSIVVPEFASAEIEQIMYAKFALNFASVVVISG